VVSQVYNDVRIRGDTGTLFSLSDLVGKDALPFFRLELLYELSEKEQLRFLLAPLSYTKSGVLDKNVAFDGQNFAAGTNTDATYKFNSYRVTYRYLFFDASKWQWYIGGTLKIRDAEVALKQGTLSASNTNVGFVPLLNLYGEYQLSDKWQLIVDFDGLAAKQGRAIDLGLKVHYDIDKNWFVGGGLRVLEGGADNERVYNFSQLNYAVFTAGFKF
jgi:hypothetical protein